MATPHPIDSLQNDALAEAIARSAAYLAQAIHPNGMFTYRVNLDPQIKVKPKYNLLRHAGAIYALATYQPQCSDPHLDSMVRLALERAGLYLRDQAIQKITEQQDAPDPNPMLAVWSSPEVNGSTKPPQAKLGGTGIGLVALLSVEPIFPGFTPIETLRALGQFIRYMQKEDGSFYSKYIPSEGGRVDQWRSLYYPGEAALGLLMLYEHDDSEAWIDVAHKALVYLARSRQRQTTVPADHWALLATQRLFAVQDKGSLAIETDLLIHHAIQVCTSILKTQVHQSGNPLYDGGFSKQGRVTPTSTRLEGLLAAQSFLPPDCGLDAHIRAAATHGINFLLRAQIQTGEFAGAMPRAMAKMPEQTPDAERFNRRVTEVRIDYIQHAMSAMMQYQQAQQHQQV